ncbi:MAG: two-component system sensor histidine kinase SapS [Enterococcus sp.]
MTIKKYLQDQLWLLSGWVGFVLLTILVLWLTPDLYVNWGDIAYLVLLEGLFLVGFLSVHYRTKKKWWQQLTNKDESVFFNQLNQAKSQEERYHQAYMNRLIQVHQEQMQAIVASQEEQIDYIDSWVHEIKVPLAASQLLLKSIEFDITDEKYTLLENELAKMNNYVEQVLYYARLDNFSKDYLIQETSLKKVITPIIRSQANYFIQNKLQFELIGDDQRVLTDEKWLSFIFKQLLSNAIKYTPENGAITVTFVKEAQGVALNLTDTGIGIPENDLRRIFDKGFTGENGRFSETHSTGLGLYLAKNLAEKIGIELVVDSKVQSGTTMTLFFPNLSYYQEQR